MQWLKSAFRAVGELIMSIFRKLSGLTAVVQTNVFAPLANPEENTPQNPQEAPKTSEITNDYPSLIQVPKGATFAEDEMEDKKQIINTSVNLPEPITPPQNPDKKFAFVKSLAIAVADKFDPICVYTHAYHETAGFRKLVGSWNYAGVKIPTTAKPPVSIKPVVVTTHEFINGIKKEVHDVFADFFSADDFMRFYVWQIERLYKITYENRNNPKLYFYGLAHDINKWATNPTYETDLEKLYNELKVMGIYEQINTILK